MFTDPRTAGADLWGMVISTQPPRHGGRLPRPHLQSWFLAARRALLASACWRDFWSGVVPQPTKDDVISRYEVGLSEQVMAAGFRIAALYDAGREAPPGWRDVVPDLSAQRPFATWRLLRKIRRPFHNPAELLPRRLLAAGIPYAKVSLLRVNHYRLAPEAVRARCRSTSPGSKPPATARIAARTARQGE